ncbi:hypothetical protein BDZ97DRAFT_1788445 [Flammula alnicola]|nr:hypothetical protein BDZ97DRAFT_1788445 [Flammula alnicola]
MEGTNMQRGILVLVLSAQRSAPTVCLFPMYTSRPFQLSPDSDGLHKILPDTRRLRSSKAKNVIRSASLVRFYFTDRGPGLGLLSGIGRDRRRGIELTALHG